MTHITVLSKISTLVSLTGAEQRSHTVLTKPAWFRPTFFAILVGIAAAVLPVRPQEPSDIAKQAQNPIANLISVPIENDFNPQTGIKKQDSYIMELKPVVPFHLSDNWTPLSLGTAGLLPIEAMVGLRRF